MAPASFLAMAGAMTAEAIPVAWKIVMRAIAVGKAAIGGAGLALAILGAYYVAGVVSAHDYLSAGEYHYALNAFAAGGGIVGALFSIFFAINYRE
jgi:hypothetical protein